MDLRGRFTEAVEDYRNNLIESFHSRMGDEDSAGRRVIKEKIICLYKEAPSGYIGMLMRYILLRDLPRATGNSDIRLGHWLQEMAHEFVDHLEKLEEEMGADESTVEARFIRAVEEYREDIVARFNESKVSVTAKGKRAFIEEIIRIFKEGSSSEEQRARFLFFVLKKLPEGSESCLRDWLMNSAEELVGELEKVQ